MSRIRANQITNQSADGAPTVQNGLVISGVTTSTTFSGSGASLTNIPSAQLTGALPAISGANLTGISGVSVANQADNRLITVTATTDALNGEANLTFDGTTLKAEAGNPILELSGTTSNGGNTFMHINANANHWCVGADNYTQQNMFVIKSGTPASSNHKFAITSAGAVGINTVAPEQSNTPSLHLHGTANDDCRIAFSTPTKSAPGSRIGYYGLNRFGIDTYDGIEMRDVTRSYATIFKIDQNGYMQTYQPYGKVRFNTHGDAGGEQKQTNVYTHTVANGMAHSSGRLTVPAAGMYYIGIHGNINDNNSAAQYLYKNGSKLDGWRWQHSDADVAWKSSMVGGIDELAANDYLEVYVTGAQDNQAWNMFTVYKVG